MKKAITKTICVIVALFSFVLCFCAFSCVEQPKDYIEVFKNNWGVDLPENMNEEFRKSKSGWGGYSTRYAVFTLEEVPSEFLADFIEERDTEIENKLDDLLENTDFEVSEKYLPKWDNDYCWKYLEYDHSKQYVTIDKCYMIYFYDSLTLVIFQCFESNW